MASVELKNIRKNYGELEVVHGVDLTIEDGIRPEHLSLGKGFGAKVSVTEPTGPEIHIYADIGEQEICSVVRERVNLKRDERIDLMPRCRQDSSVR